MKIKIIILSLFFITLLCYAQTNDQICYFVKGKHDKLNVKGDFVDKFIVMKDTIPYEWCLQIGDSLNEKTWNNNVKSGELIVIGSGIITNKSYPLDCTCIVNQVEKYNKINKTIIELKFEKINSTSDYSRLVEILLE